ncbi:MAG: hypothetical protein ACTSPV_05915 [Candidatus Hodarchaeales archaeon]
MAGFVFDCLFVAPVCLVSVCFNVLKVVKKNLLKTMNPRINNYYFVGFHFESNRGYITPEYMVIFAERKKDAENKANMMKKSFEKSGREIRVITFYRNKYIKEAEELVKEKKFIS